MASARVLLLHGLGHHRPREHWLWWLAEELRSRNIPVQYPQFPEPDAPEVATWQRLARAELEMAGDGCTVIAHSLGTVLWGSLGPALAAGAANRVALVSPPSDAVLAEVAPSWVLPMHPLAGPDTVMVGRREDPYRVEALDAIALRSSIPSVVLPGEGHITPDDGFGPYPGALEWAVGGDDDAWLNA